jgi:hypothetical protein
MVKKTSPPRRVIVVIHAELMAPTGMPLIDEMVSHVASTWKEAEKYIAGREVAPYSWWKLEQRTLDREEQEPVTRYYSHRGRLLARAPHRQALKAFERHLSSESP